MKDQRFHEFAAGVGLGLYKAVTTDTEVFLLATSGLLLGSGSRRLRGLGLALGGLFISRRADQYALMLAQKLEEISQVMDARGTPAPLFPLFK